VPSVAFITDIHGNRPALEAVLADIDGHGIETVYCLGDLIGYGSDPNGVIDLIRVRGIPTIVGNYDDGVAWDRGECGCFYRTAAEQRIGDASYNFTVAEVTPERKAYLRSLPGELHLNIAGVRLHLVHGSPRKINEYLLRDRDERTFRRLAATEEDDVLVFGHTHDPWHRMVDGVLFINVGSVGRPKDGDPRAMYSMLLLPEKTVEAARVPYDVEAYVRTIVAAGLPPELAEAIRTGH
jgi:putative phosphoesterase